MNKIILIASREFVSRVRKRTFLLVTILLPVLIFTLYGMIVYFSVKDNDVTTIAVADQSGLLGDSLHNTDAVTYKRLQVADEKTLADSVKKGGYSGYIFIPAGVSARNASDIQLKTAKNISLTTRYSIENNINDIIRQEKMLTYLSRAQLDSASSKANVRFEDLNSKEDSGIKTGVSYGIGYISGFLIYLILFIYGTMVMRGVMEEKVSRIAEVIISSVRPFQLMMGKIIGIGAVGLLQFLIWIVLVVVLRIVLMPVLFPGADGGAAAAVSQGAGKISSLLASLSNVNYPLIVGCFLFYFLGGYFIYAALFAAVGSAVNEDPQDAQSLMLPITMPIIFAFVIMTRAVQSPHSGLAKFGSYFPLTSPIVMMARVAHGVHDGFEVWELLLSMALLILGFLGTTWLAGKIYRVGILMYGKKPSWKELIRWAFRKN
jgi:ABC-2 type transport system permease protein